MVDDWDEPLVREHKDGPAFIAALFGKRPNAKGNLRHDGNVDLVTMLVLDLDGNGGRHYSRKELRKRLDGMTYLAHTTFSSTPEKPRWRVIFPLANPIPRERLAEAHSLVQDQTGLDARDTSCDNASRLHYLPSCPPSRRKHYRCIHGDAEWLDLPDSPPAVDAEGKGMGKRERAGEHSNALSCVEQRAYRALLCSPAPPKDDGQLFTLDQIAEMYRSREVCIAVARHLELPVDQIARGDESTSSNFHSPLPWRQDKNPSCVAVMKSGEDMAIHDFGDPYYKTYSLPRLKMFLAYRPKKPFNPKKRGPEQLLWALRLLIDAGIIQPAEVADLPPCPEDATPAAKKVHEGFRLLLACKGRVEGWAGEPTVFASKFIAAWCDVAYRIGVEARKYLTDEGIFHICGKLDNGTCVYQPGLHRKHPKAEGTQAPRRHRRGPNKFTEAARRAMPIMGVSDDPADCTVERILQLMALARRSPLTAGDRMLFFAWADEELFRRTGHRRCDFDYISGTFTIGVDR
jgi:hypothetical protein